MTESQRRRLVLASRIEQLEAKLERADRLQRWWFLAAVVSGLVALCLHFWGW